MLGIEFAMLKIDLPGSNLLQFFSKIDTITRGNFLGSHTFDSCNVLIDLFGSPPLLVNGTVLTVEHVMQRLEIIKNKVATVELIENLDKRSTIKLPNMDLR